MLMRGNTGRNQNFVPHDALCAGIKLTNRQLCVTPVSVTSVVVLSIRSGVSRLNCR